MWGSWAKRGGHRYANLAASLLALASLPSAALSESSQPAAPEEPRWREMWAGVDASSNVWLAYSGATFSLGGGIHDEGLKLRVAGGYGQYSYTYAGDDSDAPIRKFHVTTSFYDVLAGYLFRFGELTLKVFGGVSAITHDIAPFDEETLAYGEDIGVKAAAEMWLNLGPAAFLSVDVAWAEAHTTRSARGRLGYRVRPTLSLGLEAALNLDAQGECRIATEAKQGCRMSYDQRNNHAELLDYGRGGVFVRYEWYGGEASLSAGALGGHLGHLDEGEIDPYVTFNWLLQY